MIPAVLIAAGTLLAQEAQPLARGRVRLVGPLEEVRLDQGPRGSTRLVCTLLPGEERSVTVLLPLRPLGDLGPALTTTPSAGSATFEGYAPADAGLSELPLELRRRSRPPVGSSAVGLDPVAVLALAATSLLVLALRRRAGLGFALGLVGTAAVVAAQLRAPAPPTTVVRVLEGDAESGRWLRVEGAEHRLALEAERELALAREGRGPLVLEARIGVDATRWHAVAQGGVWRFAPADPGARRLDPAANLWGDLESVWSRGPDGSWARHGAWALGAPLPPGDAGRAPPGWLSTGLRQGTGVLVARLADGSWAGGDTIAPGTVAWIRLVGIDLTRAR